MLTEEQKRKKRNKILKIVGALMGVFLLIGCCSIGGLAFLGTEPTLTSVPMLVVTAESPLPTLAPTTAPAVTPQPTPIPTAAPTEPVVLGEVRGIGDTVTDNFVWPQCQKAVFYWSAEPDSHATASLIVHLWAVGKDRPVYLVSALEFDSIEPLKGETLQPLAGGEYYFVTESTAGAWSITVVCED